MVSERNYLFILWGKEGFLTLVSNCRCGSAPGIMRNVHINPNISFEAEIYTVRATNSITSIYFNHK